jgi:hypothetical protein
MNIELASASVGLMAATADTLVRFEATRQFMDSCGQIPVATEHILHGGMYARTIRMKLEDVILGSLIKLPTMVIVNGPVSVFAGGRWVDYESYNVLPGSAGRKSLFLARGHVDLTMIFPTVALTVEDAEEEVFAEVELLTSRREGSEETVLITGQ